MGTCREMSEMIGTSRDQFMETSLSVFGIAITDNGFDRFGRSFKGI